MSNNDDKKQTPAPKVSSGKELNEKNTPKLEKEKHTAEKGAEKKESATKTPSKIQEGDTNSSERDEHLKSADFFNADYYPEMKFVSTSFVHIDGDRYDLNGNLSVKDVTRPVTFKVLFGGEAKDGFGNMRAGFEINGEIDRNDFNIHANDVTEAGGLILGEDIQLHANIQFIKETD